MTVYIAIPLRADVTPLKNSVEHNISPEDRYELQADSGWLINFNGTTIELTNHLKITGQNAGELSPVGSALVIPVSNYYGRGPSDMWEWIKIRMES